MARLRANLAEGTITDNPLLIGATTFNSAELPRLPVVAAPDVLPIVLDPQRKNGEPEFVHVIAYDGTATSCTIARAAEDAAKFPARQHPSGTKWAHVPTKEDIGVAAVQKIRTAGSITVSSTTLVALDTALDVTIPALPGDVLFIGVSGLWDSAGSSNWQPMDAAVMVGGSPARYVSSGSATPSTLGEMAWFAGTASGYFAHVGGQVPFTVESGDIESGAVTFRLFARVNTGSRDIRGSVGEVLKFWVVNIGS